jgi:hypothetical protein
MAGNRSFALLRARARGQRRRKRISRVRVPAASHAKSSSRLPAISFSGSEEPVTLPPGSRQTCDQTVANRIACRRQLQFE